MTLSKNICLLAIGFIIISTKQSVAQKEMLFRVKLKPNTTYITDMVNNLQMEMDFDLDSAKKKQMESGGMKLPMHMNMLQEMTLSTKTGAVAADKRLPMTMSYDKASMTTTMNGKEIKQPDKLTGMKIKVYATEEGKVSIDTIEGNVNAAVKEALQKTIAKVYQSVGFPNKAMKIGDTFSQEVPMEMPAAGGADLTMFVSVTYTLKEIKESQALFDYTQSISMSLKTEKNNTTATGLGTGKMIYDIAANYITNTTSDMVMIMNTQGKDMGMKTNMKMQTSLKAKVL